MPTFTLLLLTFFNSLPWLAIALLAVLTLHRRKDSKPLMLQAFGAVASFTLALSQWFFVDLILHLVRASPGLIAATQGLFSFLLFIALATFALGYGAEKLSLHKPVPVSATPAPVTATPASTSTPTPTPA